MSADEKVSWGEVCKKVGFSDNLYRVCKDKVGAEFNGGAPLALSNGESDEDGESNEDFGKRLRKSAKPIPPPPPEDWEQEPEGLMEQVMYGDLGKYLIYSGIAALVFWLILRSKMTEGAATTAPTKKLSADATAPKAA
jgi:hypothetical protein